jgi:single-stranded-DNA-specific exonuclease
MSKNWQIQASAPQDFFAKFSGYNPLILQLLYNRGITTCEKIDEFFNPDYFLDLFDPFLLPDMEKAVLRLAAAAEKKERVAIFGDYDADGVTSSVLLSDFLKNALSLSGQVYIPDRQSEGYGLNITALDWLKNKKIKLVITCDCGSSNKEEIDYGRQKGLDFIVLDHHYLHQNFPTDYIIVNPKRKESKYPFSELAACGVVFKFIQAFLRREKELIKKGVNPERFEKWLLDLVAIGTIADCVPLISENRTLVKYGMKVLAKTKRIGLAKLFEKCGIRRDQLSTYDISFLIAPRINAAGRIDHATTAYKLLTTQEINEAEKAAKDLEEKNYNRQKICEEIVLEAKEQIGKAASKEKILFAAKEGWPNGVVGLVAGKICEEFFRPTFILSRGKNEIAGSARSIMQFNVIKAIEECRDLLLEYGGHKQAAGIALKNENLEKFVAKMRGIADKKLKAEDLIPQIKIDAKLNLENVSWKLYEDLQNFEPCGFANLKPNFMAQSVKVCDIQLVGYDRQHLKLRLASTKNNTKNFAAIGFNQVNKVFQKIKVGDLIDLVFEISVNIWNGQKNLELKVVDFRKA